MFAQLLFLSWLCIAVTAPAAAASQKYDYTFFQGTQYPLTVTFLRGEQEGPTVMVQGGIQGDEPSGFISAQILTGATVTKGNLIIVPRANVPSINLRKRQVNVDMNRRFDQEYNRFYEDRLARVVRFLLAQSDALIHLHEGSGFYHPTYIDQMRNPKRYGQSIIVDTLDYGGFALGDTVENALDELNHDIPEKYRFRLFNTQTFDENSDYKEMRKSLTCYALTARGIPAVAVEVSKQISQLDWKVQRQVEATQVLLKHYGVLVQPPTVTSEVVKSYAMQGVGVRINGRILHQGQVLDLVRGAPLTAKAENGESNELAPSLALFASDRPGVNLLSAPRMALDRFNNLELRSDGKRILNAKVRFRGANPGVPDGDALSFLCWLNGQPMFVQSGQSLDALEGDQLIIEGVWGSSRREVLNLKGYVARPKSNDGQDIGWEIILDPENFMRKYQLDTPKGSPDVLARFQVVRETPGAKKARFFVDIRPRTVHAIRLRDSHGQSLVIPWASGRDYPLPGGEYVLVDTWSNGSPAKLTPTAQGLPIRTGGSFRVPEETTIELVMRQATTFAPVGAMTFRPSGMAER